MPIDRPSGYRTSTPSRLEDTVATAAAATTTAERSAAEGGKRGAMGSIYAHSPSLISPLQYPSRRVDSCAHSPYLLAPLRYADRSPNYRTRRTTISTRLFWPLLAFSRGLVDRVGRSTVLSR
ncbi:hypothetical protein PENTCL1PPCAC_4562, partial [Pristionchus entomophagus]